MCLIVAERNDVISGDIEASLPGTKNPKIDPETGTRQYRALWESVSVDSVTRERWRAFIPVAREPKKPSARHVSTRENATLAGLLQQKHGATRPQRQHEVDVHQRADLRVDLHERQQEKPLQAGEEARCHGK